MHRNTFLRLFVFPFAILYAAPAPFEYQYLTSSRRFLSNLKPLENVMTKVFLATARDDKALDTRYDATIVSAFFRNPEFLLKISK